MSSTSPDITEYEIHAYVDGQLAAERVAAVEAFLQAHPDEARRVQQLRELNQLLRAQHNDVLAEPIPAALSVPTPAPMPRRWTESFRPLRIAASVAWLAIGGALGWIAHNEQPRVITIATTLPMQAAIAHVVYVPEVLHPVEVTAAQQEHLVAWLSKRLNNKMRVPQLRPQGYHLVGGRLLPGDNQPAAQFMYENGSGQRVTLYVKTSDTHDGSTAFQYASERGVSVFYWIDGPLGYALSGNIDKSALLTLATAVYQELAQ